MRNRIEWSGIGPAVFAVAALGCSGAEEATRVGLPVVVDNSGMTPVHTDLGYDVVLSEARLVVEDLEFTIAGEAHSASLWQRMGDLLVAPAHAHPGHYQGGDVTGELPGHFILDLISGNAAPLGVADLIVGHYQSSNFTFGHARAEDGLPAGDPLLGHTAHLVGQATQGGVNHPFRVKVDAPLERQLVGAPFDVEIVAASPVILGFELMTRDPLEGDTLFDGIDFGGLPETDGIVLLDAASADPGAAAAYDNVRRALLTHDHFEVNASGGS